MQLGPTGASTALSLRRTRPNIVISCSLERHKKAPDGAVRSLMRHGVCKERRGGREGDEIVEFLSIESRQNVD